MSSFLVSHSWYENEDPSSVRKFSFESDDQNALGGLRRMKKKKVTGSESLANSLASNLNKISQGPLEVNKMFLTDDYFSDVNPRSMRRLMNVIYVMGRLLKAFGIDFNWHHLARWANITEQWPYHTSWIILFVENYGDKLEDNLSLKVIYDKVQPYIPTQKEREPLIEFDRDRKKLDVFLSRREKTLTIADIKVFMPFTINLDPFLRKVIKEEVQNIEQLGFSLFSSCRATEQQEQQQLLTRRQAAELSKKMSEVPGQVAGVPPYLLGQPLSWPYSPAYPGQAHLQHLQHQAAAKEERRNKTISRPVLPRELQGRVLSSFSLDNVCLLISNIEGINTSMVETYCASIISNNINGQVLLHCEVPELRSVINMNFGDWELFKLVLTAMRDDEESGPAQAPVSHQPHTEPEVTVTVSSSSHDNLQDKTRARRKQSNIEKQVAMEEATVSGLLSTLNEEAKEDILLEEISNAREVAGILSQSSPLEKQTSHETEESDYLYISHSSPGPKLFTAQEDPERGRSRTRQSQEMIWSATTSRAGSSLELETAGTSKARKPLSSRANTVVSFTRPQSTSLEEDDPYSWLSHTAPASPRETRHRLLSDPAQHDRESDPGQSKMSIFSNRSVRRTKKKPRENQDESDDNGGLSRTSSRVKIDRIKRKVRNVLTSNEPGQLPMVQKAKPNHEEYHQFSQSQKTSRSSSFSESVCLSDESLSSPEQQTIAKRPDSEVTRPALQTIFSPAREEEEVQVMTAVLPDGSKMTASTAKKMFTIGDKTEQQ